jgi:hypothetical protein
MVEASLGAADRHKAKDRFRDRGALVDDEDIFFYTFLDCVPFERNNEGVVERSCTTQQETAVIVSCLSTFYDFNL